VFSIDELVENSIEKCIKEERKNLSAEKANVQPRVDKRLPVANIPQVKQYSNTMACWLTMKRTLKILTWLERCTLLD